MSQAQMYVSTLEEGGYMVVITTSNGTKLQSDPIASPGEAKDVAAELAKDGFMAAFVSPPSRIAESENIIESKEDGTELKAKNSEESPVKELPTEELPTEDGDDERQPDGEGQSEDRGSEEPQTEAPDPE